MAERSPAGVRLQGWGWRHAGRSAWALRGVDLVIEPGERVLLLGPSGAGKSTLLLALAGLLDADSGDTEGTIEVDGVDPRAARDRTALLLQDPESQIVMARCGDDVAFGLENAAVPPAAIWPAVDAALRSVGFPYTRDHPTEALSGGEQQRLVLAGSLALRPGLLLLDEPTANLDPAGARLIRAALGEVLAASAMTLVLVEHRVAESLPLVERVVVLEPGAGVVADGSPGEVFDHFGAELAARGVWVPGALQLAAREAVARSGNHAVAGVDPAGVQPVRWPFGPGADPAPIGTTVNRDTDAQPSPQPAGPRTAGPTPHQGTELLVAESVSYRHRGAVSDAVTDASIALRSGAVTAVVGPNGSGKSSLALMLAGLAAPTGGVINGTPALAGADSAVPPVRWPASRLARRIGTVFQDPEHQFLTRTVADELALGPLRTGAGAGEARRRADELMARLRLDHLSGANPFTLSGGEKRRLSVATALACRPLVLVLDEPTFGQDLRTWLELLALLGGLRDDGSAICCVTHDEDFVTWLADDLVPLEAGHTGPARGQRGGSAAASTER